MYHYQCVIIGIAFQNSKLGKVFPDIITAGHWRRSMPRGSKITLFQRLIPKKNIILKRQKYLFNGLNAIHELYGCQIIIKNVSKPTKFMIILLYFNMLKLDK